MTVTTELIVVRHGEANCNVHGVVGGETACTGLTSRGQDQVRRLAAGLAADHRTRRFDVVYSTPRRRVRESAAIVESGLGVAAIERPDLLGPEHGEADGLPWLDVKTAFGGSLIRHPDKLYAAGSESWTAYLDRVTRALRDLLTLDYGKKILIVGHGETIHAAHVLLTGATADARAAASFVTDHASVSHWALNVNRFEEEVWMLVRHNDTRHLPGEGTR